MRRNRWLWVAVLAGVALGGGARRPRPGSNWRPCRSATGSRSSWRTRTPRSSRKSGSSRSWRSPNEIDFSWTNTQIDKWTILFRPLVADDSVRVINQSYPPGENALVWYGLRRQGRPGQGADLVHHREPAADVQLPGHGRARREDADPADVHAGVELLGRGVRHGGRLGRHRGRLPEGDGPPGVQGDPHRQVPRRADQEEVRLQLADRPARAG